MPMLKITHQVNGITTELELLNALKEEDGFMVAVPAQLVFSTLPADDIHLMKAKDYLDSIQAFLEKTDETLQDSTANKVASGTMLTGVAVRKNNQAPIKYRLGSYAIDESNTKLADVGYYLLAKCPPGAKSSAGQTIDTPAELPDTF